MAVLHFPRSYHVSTALKSLGILFIALTLIWMWKPLLFWKLKQYTNLIIKEWASDRERFLTTDYHLAHKEWRLHQMESRFGQQYCKEFVKPRKDVAWLTAMVNDDFVLPALVLGYALQTFSCHKNMIAFVTDGVSQGFRNALREVGWTLHVVEAMDCDWMEVRKGRKATHSGYLGTHTRFHAWNFTQYSKIVYLDPDMMPITNIDELFDTQADFAASPCARPGVLDPCFNAGLLVFKPDRNDYNGLMQLWDQLSDYECPNDQVLLWHFYAGASRWLALHYSYNVRRITYRPMKAYHFACCIPPKPWWAKCRPSRKEARAYDKPITNTDSMAVLYWKYFYDALEKYKLDTWWKTTKFFRHSQEFGDVTYSDCWQKLES